MQQNQISSIVLIFALILSACSKAEPKAEASVETKTIAAKFDSIFDGESLQGWDGNPKFWSVENGEIVGKTIPENRTPKNTFLIWEGGELEDFELKVEFKLVNHNSGIQYRSFRIEDKERPWAVGGYQADISEDNQWTGATYGEGYKEIMALCGEKVLVGAKHENRQVVGLVGDRTEILSHIKTGDWNEYHIIARGNQCIQKINGVMTAEFSEGGEDRLEKGLIAFQLHEGPPMEVRFRNVRLRQLDSSDKKQILFLAGKKSHGYGAHEHKAGSMLLARSLNESGLDVTAQVVTEGSWPEPWVGYDKPDSIVMYCDGFKRHMAKDHQDKIQMLSDAGVGVACLHFGVEVEPDVLGKEFLDWIGGYFEIGWSVNPHWDAVFETFPDHPIANGVQPFTVRDEWYYHMRFQPEMKNVTPILAALPPLTTLTDRIKVKNRGSNPTVMAEVKAGKKQVVAWAYDRPNGGRGFGFTGGHFHHNWQHDDFRKVVLNALLWTAKAEVPTAGVPSRTPSDIDLELNQDYSKPKAKK